MTISAKRSYRRGFKEFACKFIPSLTSETSDSIKRFRWTININLNVYDTRRKSFVCRGRTAAGRFRKVCPKGAGVILVHDDKKIWIRLAAGFPGKVRGSAAQGRSRTLSEQCATLFIISPTSPPRKRCGKKAQTGDAEIIVEVVNG